MGFNELKQRIQYIDKNAQSRAVGIKQKVLQKAINQSYFGFEVTKPEISDEKKYKVLITSTSSSLGDSEAKKHISSFFEDKFEIGTIVHWLKTNSYWLIYESEKNEIAYFQGKMIEAKSYQIITDDGKVSTWGSISLTDLEGNDMFDRTLITREDSVLKIMIPSNEQNRKIFVTGKKIKVLDTLWKIYHVDYITKNGIIIIKAERNFDTNSTDDLIINENNIVNDNTYIDGPNFITPYEEVTYTISDGVEGEWSIPDNPNIIKTINNDGSLTIVWNNGRKRNDFTISYGEYSKDIIVKSLM